MRSIRRFLDVCWDSLGFVAIRFSTAIHGSFFSPGRFRWRLESDWLVSYCELYSYGDLRDFSELLRLFKVFGMLIESLLGPFKIK